MSWRVCVELPRKQARGRRGRQVGCGGQPRPHTGKRKRWWPAWAQRNQGGHLGRCTAKLYGGREAGPWWWAWHRRQLLLSGQLHIQATGSETAVPAGQTEGRKVNSNAAASTLKPSRYACRRERRRRWQPAPKPPGASRSVLAAVRAPPTLIHSPRAPPAHLVGLLPPQGEPREPGAAHEVAIVIRCIPQAACAPAAATEHGVIVQRHRFSQRVAL